MLCPYGMCTNFKDHHYIKQWHKFILSFVMPKPVSYSWKLSPSLYPNQSLKHVQILVYVLVYIWLYSVIPAFEIIFLQLDLVDNIFTLCPHNFCYHIGWVLGLHDVCKFDCIQACIQDECFICDSCVISKKPKYSTIYFTIFTW